MKGIYYIKNDINEYEAAIVGYFPTLAEAKEALKECSDWYRAKGTGRIYFQEYGLYISAQLVFKSGGLDANGKLIEVKY